MEKRLSRLFDYQRFEKNSALGRIIAETENRYAKALSDDDLSLVAAAGEIQDLEKINGINSEENVKS